MKKRYLMLCICGIIGGSSVITYGVEINSIVAQKTEYQVLVEGNNFENKNPIVTIDGTTYLSLKDLGEALGVKVNWNADKKQVELGQKNIAQEVKSLKDKNGLAIIGMYPQDGDQDIYLKWGYLNIVFNESMKGVSSTDRIYLIDEDGKRIKIREGKPGVTAKDNMILSLEKELDLNTNYKLIIPKETMISSEGKKYGLPIDIEFKTAANVVKGKIQSSENYFGSKIILKGKENIYESQIVDKNEFVFVNIPEGKFNVVVEHNNLIPIECDITIKGGKVNNFSIK